MSGGGNGQGVKLLLYFSLVLVLVVLVLSIANLFETSITGNSITGNSITGKAAKVKPQCDDGVDNDRDGACDYNGCVIGRGSSRITLPRDLDCSDRNDNSEFCVDTPEICDGKDNNCNGYVDEGGVCGTITYYCDADGDRYLSMLGESCSSYGCVPAGCSRTKGNDCNDNDYKINPGVAEVCGNNIDDNCNGQVDEFCNGGSGGGGNLLNVSCKSISYNGELNSSLNIVMVPSGFNGDMNLFEQKAKWIASVFDRYEPLSSNNLRLNVLYVTEEGGNYCYFNCSGIDRLLCCTQSVAFGLSSICTPGPRQTLVVHNSEKYGGAGYGNDMATTSVNSASPQVAVHEFGHSAFKLADEYNYGWGAPPAPNCEVAGCPKWQSWIGYKGVNCRPNACANGQYYTSENTIMASLGYAFEEVNLRHSCCAYGKITGQYPQYCEQFGISHLNSYCALNASSGGGGVPMSMPREYSFVRRGNDWVLENVAILRQGAYSQVEPRRVNRKPGVRQLSLRLYGDTGAVVNLFVDDEQDVESFSTSEDSRYVVLSSLEAFKIRLDSKFSGRINRIEINGKRVFFPGERR